MKVRVKIKFKDKHTKELHKRGDVLDLTKERYEEICAKNKNLVEIVKEELTEPEEGTEQETSAEPEASAEPETETDVESEAETESVKKSRGKRK